MLKLLSATLIILACVGCSVQQGVCPCNPCKNGATCYAGVGGSYYCQCAPGFDGTDCENYNICASQQLTCFNGGTCVTNSTDPRGFECQCPVQYEGDQCQTVKIDVCTAQRPCQNGGSCLMNSDLTLGYWCRCPALFEGSNCQTMITNGACASDPCMNRGTCFRSHRSGEPDSLDFLCVCKPGYTGRQCEEVLNVPGDVCELIQPCQNGGMCFISSAESHRYICLCPQHFSGSNCEISDLPDLCLINNPCQNNSTCVHLTGASSVMCQCAPGYVGEYCDWIDTGSGPCLPNPCENGGLCNPDPFAANGYTCSCLPSFSGINCQLEYQGCESNPCYNSGTCVVQTYGAYFCQCPEGYAGKLCQDAGPCASSPCFNGGICTENPQVRAYYCICPPEFMGVHCQQLASEDPCISNPCTTGTCFKSDSPTGVPFVCACPSDTVGALCDRDPCLSTPCVNGGTCNPIFNPVTSELVAIGCACPTGFTGPTCAVVGPCQSNPCQNGGSCIDSTGSVPDPLMDWADAPQPSTLLFFCMCTPEWTGTTCSETSDSCTSNPCQNNGECVRVDDGYICRCQGLYSGTRCESMMVPCSPNPCMNSGRCVESGSSYTCACVQPYVGTHCERSDPCASAPCQNDATCFRSWRDDQFICQCAQGFTGTYCQEIVDHCLSGPCQNDGTCFNGGQNGFICVCTEAFYGRLCEEAVQTTTTLAPSTVTQGSTPFHPDACRPNDPCLNGGTCLPIGTGIFSYTCLCPVDYAGLTCAVHLERPESSTPMPTPTSVTTTEQDSTSVQGTISTTTPRRLGDEESTTVTTPYVSEICFHDASVYEEGAVRVTDCVKCTCINGEWLCGERDCDCTIDGVRYSNADTWTVDCNTCICSGGEEICTEINCGKMCEHNGVHYMNGDSRQSECNTCMCDEGDWICTDHSCGDACLFGGDKFLEGEMRKESCNSCFCLKDAQWLCTVRDCKGSPIIVTVSFEINYNFAAIEQSQQRFITVFKEDMRERYNLAKQNIQNVMVFLGSTGSIKVMFDLVEVKDSNVNVEAVASDLEIRIQKRDYTLNYDDLDLFADPSSFTQEKLDTGPGDENGGGGVNLEQETIILIAVIGCGTLGLIIVVASVCYFTKRAPRRARTEYGESRLPMASDRVNTEDGFVNNAYQEGLPELHNNNTDSAMPRSYRVVNND